MINLLFDTVYFTDSVLEIIFEPVVMQRQFVSFKYFLNREGNVIY